MQTTTRISRVLSIVTLLLLGMRIAQGQFTAFNDHFTGAGTHPNATTWNVYGTTGGAPGNAGALKDINTGATLPVVMTITNLSVGGGTTAGGPSAGTPAYNTFNGYVDWGSGTVNHAIQTAPGQAVGRVFSGLDPNKRYRYTGTGVRAGGYADRWIRIALMGAQDFTSAHTPGCLTNGTAGASVAVNECAINTGSNTGGELAIWENIQPAADGTFAVVCTKYDGAVPGGSSAGPYGYSIAADKLEEFNVTPSPAVITNHPANQAVVELTPAQFSVGAGGNPFPRFQWYRGGTLIPDATNSSYRIESTPYSFNGSTFTVTASNFVDGLARVVTSGAATLTVTPDTTAPTIVGVSSSGGFLVQVTFSERVTQLSATNLTHFQITNSAGVLQVTNAVLAADGTNVTLYTAMQTIGVTYTLVVNGIRDLSAAANVIAANSSIQFTAVSITSSDVGTPSTAGTVTAVSGVAFNVAGAGSGIGGTSDQFTFGYQQKSGDFDLRVRVADFGGSDPWSAAALMARESVAANSMFAAAIAAPPMTGCFFESRTTLGGNSTRAGNFPGSYPNAWLRLRRAGNVFTGFASADGRTWVQLGSATLSVGSVYVGFAVTSRDTTRTALAQFRDYSDTPAAATVVTSVVFDSEPLSATARTTPMVISEIMYKAGGTNSANLEYVELYNSNPFYEDISGYRLTGDISYGFPPNTIVPAGAFVVVARNPAAVQAAYGITGVLGPYTNSLATKGTIRLRSEAGSILLQVEYSNDNPWPVAADATGHSLVVTRGSWGQNDPKSWDVSDRRGGSPGKHEPLRVKSGLRSVVINEILAHTDLPLVDYIELYNYSTQSVDISGCYLSDSASTIKFRIPAGTVLGPSGFVSFTEPQIGFALTHEGETIYFRSADGNQMIDALQFEPQENGVAFGRYPDGAGEFHRLTDMTPGTNNASILIDDIVINEVMYAPISEEDEDQYVELYNQGTNIVDLSGWTFSTAIGFTFPEQTLVAPGGYVVVAKNYTNLFARYANLNPGNTFGNFSGSLKRNGERLALAKPDYDVSTNGTGQLVTNIYYVVVDEVTYQNGGRWGNWTDQGGSSLELIDPRSNHRLAYNWGDSDESGKAPWTLVEHTGILDTGSVQGGGAIDRLELTMLGEGECLVDDVEVRSPASGANLIPNPGFEGGVSSWAGTGNHPITLENSGRTGSRSIRIRADGNGDTGANTVRSLLSPALAANQVATLKAYVKWQRGWPEITLRARGGFLEAYGRLEVPQNLGTPGARNSRALTNGAPAIQGVVHSPVLPQAGEAALVTARVHDGDGLANVTLFWRVDAAAPPAYTALAMNDSGISGDVMANDGIFTARLPVQNAGTMVSFYVEATDSLGATNQFPRNPVPRRECLVRWGDPIPTSAFAAYRLWMSRANVTAYINRPALSNQDIDGTMVVGNNRIIYNVGSHYSNSPYHQGQNSSPETGSTHFSIRLPGDDKYLGTDRFNKVHAPGNGGFDDTTLQREQTAFWFARKLGLPYLYRRYVMMYVNGNRKGGANALQEDTQRPGGDMIDQWFEDEPEGRLYKLQPWFEFQGDFTALTGGTAAGFENKLWCTLTRNLSTNLHKITRYRQNYLSRSADKTANDYTNVIALIEAANVPPSSPAYWPNLSGMIDVEEWARIFAVEHAVGNWDSFGNRNSQNMYGYKPNGGKWKLMIWDYNIVLGSPSNPDMPSAANLFQFQSTQDPVAMANLNAHPALRRAWWRGYKDLTVGPGAHMWHADPIMDAKYAAFRASGVNPLDPIGIKNFISTARQNISNEVMRVDINGFNVPNTIVNATSNQVTVSGVAGLDVTDICINGASWPVTWTTISNWTATVVVSNTAQLRVAAFNRRGELFGATNSVTVNYAPAVIPDPRGYVVFNEIMYDPAPNMPGAEFIEIHNTHTNYAFDLSGWRVNGVDFTFPAGSSISPRGHVLIVKDRVAFNVAYGASLLIAGQYAGNLQGDGETLSLIKPGPTPAQDLVVDQVRYEGSLPFPLAASDTGSSLQLVDAAQDNARAGNWTARHIPAIYTDEVSTPARTNEGWRFVSVTGKIGADKRLLIYLDAPGSVVIDDLALVAGETANVGENFIVNGDFETPLGPEWVFGTNMLQSGLIGNLVHSGGGALMLTQNFAGGILARDLVQTLPAAPASQETCTLSLWLFATNVTSSSLTVRIVSSSLTTNSPIGLTISPSNYVPPQLVSPATNYATPGAANQFTTALPAFQTLWINEVQAENLSGGVDNFGQLEPWIEIYNPGTNVVSLDGLYLSSTYTNLTEWAFPAGLTIAPRGFKVVWCDGQPAQTTSTDWHAGFRLAAAEGTLALSRMHNGEPQVLDYVNYRNLFANRSYGSYPDGQPFSRFTFYYVTPGATNDARSAPVNVVINEWMAANTSIVTDPADSKFSDWFEVFNPTTNTVSLAGYYFTDELTDKTKFRLTTAGTHTIPPGGHLLVWADDDIGQNTSNRIDAHVSFKLSKSGGAIGIFGPDGTQIDAVTYSTGLVNIAEGRFPDGTAAIRYLTNPTPRTANFVPGEANTPPVLAAIGSRVLYVGQSLNFTASAVDADVPAQPLGFSLDPGAPNGATISSAGVFAWAPGAAGNYTLTVRVRDTGSPPLSDFETFTVDVLSMPRFGSFVRSANGLTLTWNSHVGQIYRVEYKDDLAAETWSFLRDVPAAGADTSVEFNVAVEGQRFYRIRVLQ